MMAVSGIFWVVILAVVVSLVFRLGGQPGRGQPVARASGLNIL